ncbi:MAG: glycerophosphodiester phosphodiesterase [Planctomycetota bacterium]
MKIMGHRGARHEAPENTLPSIQRALDAGCEAIEVDVQPTRDGGLVVIHDETLERTTDGQGRVDAHDLAALRALDAGDGARVPTLPEVLALCRGRAELFVELKSPGCEARVVEAIRAADQAAECLVKSFVHPWLETVKALEPRLRTACLLYGRPSDPAGVVRAAGADVLSLGIALVDEALIEACHAGGFGVCVWNLNDPSQVARYRAWGVDYLGTDVPSAVCAAR